MDPFRAKRNKETLTERAAAKAVALDPLGYGDIAKLHVGDDVLVFLCCIPRAFYDSGQNVLKLSKEFPSLVDERWHEYAMTKALPNFRGIPLQYVEQEWLDQCLHVRSRRTIAHQKTR